MRAPDRPAARRRGLTFPELLLLLVALAALVPVALETSTRAAADTTRGRLVFLATQAGRMELQALRSRDLFGRAGGVPYEGHGWRGLGAAPLPGLPSGRERGALPADYARIETRAIVKLAEEDPRVARVVVEVRYQDAAVAGGRLVANGETAPVAVLRTVVADRWFR